MCKYILSIEEKWMLEGEGEEEKESASNEWKHSWKTSSLAWDYVIFLVECDNYLQLAWDCRNECLSPLLSFSSSVDQVTRYDLLFSCNRVAITLFFFFFTTSFSVYFMNAMQLHAVITITTTINWRWSSICRGTNNNDRGKTIKNRRINFTAIPRV